jgi:hypothetical protein
MVEGAAGTALTIVLISTLGLSTPLIVWLTQCETVVGLDKLIVGAVLEAVPPVEDVYQFNVPPLLAGFRLADNCLEPPDIWHSFKLFALSIPVLGETSGVKHDFILALVALEYVKV